MATARVAITVQSYAGLPELGVELTEAASNLANGNRFANIPGDAILIARNSGGVSYTVTFSYLRRNQTVSQAAITLPTGKTWVFGPFASEFGDHLAADEAPGDVYVSANNAAVLFSALRVPGIGRG